MSAPQEHAHAAFHQPLPSSLVQRPTRHMKLYTVGFAFTEDAKHVVLIRKSKPVWQAGLLNGIGGHVEHGESSHAAQVREFAEETGLIIPTWEKFLVLTDCGHRWRLLCHRVFLPVRTLQQAHTTSDEGEVSLFRMDVLRPYMMLSNMAYHLPMAADRDWQVPVRGLQMVDVRKEPN